MGTTRDEIRAWLAQGKIQGATHTIIACDTYDHEDYPVHVMPGDDPRAKYEEYNGKNMQRVMEVYSHAIDHESQLSEPRAFHLDPLGGSGIPQAKLDP